MNGSIGLDAVFSWDDRAQNTNTTVFRPYFWRQGGCVGIPSMRRQRDHTHIWKAGGCFFHHCSWYYLPLASRSMQWNTL